MISKGFTAALALTLCSGCELLEKVPAPSVPPTARAPSHFGAPLYRSSGAAPAAYRVFAARAGCPANAPTVVFIHGLGDFGYSLSDLAHASAPCATKVIVDLPGLGESPADDSEITSERVIAALVDIVEREARGRRAILVGHSMGGTIALRVAARRPELVAGAVVMSSPTEPFELGDNQKFVLDHWRTLLPALRLIGPYAVMVDTYEAQTATKPNPGRVYRAMLARQSSIHSRFAGAEALVDTVLGREAMQQMPAERAKIRARLLFVYGSSDGWRAPPTRDFTSSAGAASVELPGIGHLIHAEAPQAVASRVSAFIDETWKAENPGEPRASARRVAANAEIEAGDEIYGPTSEVFPVVGAFVLHSHRTSDAGPLIGIAKGSVDRAYPLETGRATLLAGIARPVSGDEHDRSYARLGGRIELVWRWVGGVLLEGSALGGEDGFAGFGAIGYVPSLIPWVRGYVGYGALPDLDAGWIFGLEANFALTKVVY